MISGDRVDIILEILEVMFCLANPGINHQEWMFETAFSSDEDEVIVDAVSTWIVGDGRAAPGPCARYIAKRVERNAPFSPMLQQQYIHAIECIWRRESIERAESETVHLSNCLVGVQGRTPGIRIMQKRAPLSLRRPLYFYSSSAQCLSVLMPLFFCSSQPI